jgi:ATP-dependent DNA helicase RecQ
MTKRMARKGKNAGNYFWGCSTYPKCKEIVNFSTDSDSQESIDPNSEGHQEEQEPDYPNRGRVNNPVTWYDGTLQHPAWEISHETVGVSLRSMHIDYGDTTKNCFVAIHHRDGSNNFDNERVKVAGTLKKILQRGEFPAIHPLAEQNLYDILGLATTGVQQTPGDISPVLETTRQITDVGLPVSPTPEYGIRFDLLESDLEVEFVEIFKSEFPEHARWLIPQASYDLLLQAAGEDSQGSRRCDFLLCLPGSEPLVIEIDGVQHGDQQVSDRERDKTLEKIGIKTVRVATEEIHSRGGQNFELIRNHVEETRSTQATDTVLIWGPVQLHRLLLAISESIRLGLVNGKSWYFEVEDETNVAVELVGTYLPFIKALFKIWGLHELAPETIGFIEKGTCKTYRLDGNGLCEMTTEHSEGLDVNVRILLEYRNTPFEKLPNVDSDTPHIVVRSVSLHIQTYGYQLGGAERHALAESNLNANNLREILRSIFAKDDFREGQLEAIVEILSGRDVAVLLPTGAGKSIIYQLSGLLLPGCTLIIDPLVALMEDQTYVMSETHRISRTITISSQSTARGETPMLLEQIRRGNGYFIFVSPERLQMQDFRDALHAVKQVTPINLCVIDEAHCVSEWGHDFRTSYLTLGNVLRNTCCTPGGNAPPLAALTGTASRAVLKDVLFQLQIHQDAENSIIKPKSFDRPELEFMIRKCDTSQDEATLGGTIASLPSNFGSGAQTFFTPTGKNNTMSGLTFVATVKGTHNIVNASAIMQEATGQDVRMYSGSPPGGWNPRDWERVKRLNARSFKDNEVIALATTKAFGMGIDKPNIRWVIHWGLPNSLEAYYQEVGRAGRDGKRALCSLILTEYDPKRNQQLLAADRELSEINASVPYSQRDDVTTALFFHTGTFLGVDEELESLINVSGNLDPQSARQERQLAWKGNPEQEQIHRAIHRLVILGVIADYTVDYSGRTFEVTVDGVQPADIPAALIAFIKRSQPQSFEQYSQSINLEPSTITVALEECGKLLIEFVYDTIEKSRRRSLREMWIAASQSRDGETLRRRILDYLTEGDIGPVLEKLLDEDTQNVIEWKNLWESIDDAGELRGASARLLASYPDSPMLLITRGLTEALASAGNDTEFILNIGKGLENLQQSRQTVDNDPIVESVLKSLFQTIENSSENSMKFLIILTRVSRELGIISNCVNQFIDTNWDDEDTDPELREFGLTINIERLLTLLEPLERI